MKDNNIEGNNIEGNIIEDNNIVDNNAEEIDQNDVKNFPYLIKTTDSATIEPDFFKEIVNNKFSLVPSGPLGERIDSLTDYEEGIIENFKEEIIENSIEENPR